MRFSRGLTVWLLSCLVLTGCTSRQALPVTPADSPTPKIIKATVTPGQPAPSPSPPPTNAPTQAAPRHSVMVISWDGGGAEAIYDLIADGRLPAFAALANRGIRAEYALSVDPPLTATAQYSIATGSYPSRTGIVSNAFHNPTDSYYWYRIGYDDLLDQAVPIWVTASRAGLKTAALFFVGGSPMLPGQTADYTIGYGVRDAYSRQEKVKLSPVAAEWQGEALASYSPPYEGSFTIREVARIYLYVLDTSDDQTSNYDTVVLNTRRAVEASSPRLKIGDWSSLVLMPTSVSGADFLLQQIAQDGTPQEVTLFFSNVCHNVASPRPFLEALNRKFGFFPYGADSYALEHGWITPEDNLYLLQRQTRWMAEVTAWVYTQYNPDLLFTWQDGFDSAGHSFWLRDPRQLNYSPENASLYASYFDQAVSAADQALQVMLQPVDLENTTVMLVSDHGISLLHTTVYVNTILEQAGLLALDSREYVVVNESQAFAVASGGAVNIYINLKGHEKNGIVASEEYPQLQAQIVELLSTLTDPETGEKVFQRVLRQDELASIHLDHLNSGDVFAQANPGYNLDGWRGKDFIFEKSDFYGQHGYASTLPEMYAMFIAAGVGIPDSGQVIPPVHIIDYAPTIAFLLGFTPAPTVEGRSFLK